MDCVISFGTDGWRSKMDTDFTVANLAIAVQGIANYLNKTGYNKKGIVIGYDTRKNSRTYAEEVAKVLIGNELRAFLTKEDAPIPVVTHAILMRGLDGGVMITASHNPPEYNGIKFIPYYASPALPDITDPIMEEIRKVWASQKPKKGSLGKVEPITLKESYFADVMKRINVMSIKGAKLNIVFDALYGTSRTYIPEILKKLDVKVEVHHDFVDPTFGGAAPNPSMENLKEISKIVVNSGLHLGLACDGDADRMGVIDDQGNFIHANILFALLLEYELSLGKTGDVVRTVGTTHLIDRIAKAYKLKVYETPVGAKYVGQYMREKKLLMGGEESGGMIFREHIAEKDGIYANLKVLEMVAYYKKPLSQIIASLFKKYGKVYFTLINFPVTDEGKGKAMKNIAQILPEVVAGKEVVKKIEIDGFKFVLEDGSWLLVRPSGTEPLLRLYGESSSEAQLSTVLEEGKKLLEQAQN